MSRVNWATAVAVVLAVGGCSGLPHPEPVAPPPIAGVDSGTEVEVSAPEDVDAGGSDPSPDSGTGPQTPDAGSASDAGAALDAGTDAPDAGTDAPDAGTDPGSTGGSGTFPLRDSPIAAENQREGSRSWQLENGCRTASIYADKTSYLPGETVELHAAAEQEGTGSWELWRLGYYDGRGGRRVLSGGTLTLHAGQTNTIDLTTGLVQAGWPVSARFTLPTDAPTGVYVVKMTTPVGQSYGTFVVRERTPSARVLVVIAINTYQAYNDWGGTSLYTNARTDFRGGHAVAVSFDRPYSRGNGTGLLFEKDRQFITFVEGQGYDVAYVTDVDLDARPELTERRALVVIQGHSEYWTRGMRDASDATVARGTHMMFLGANNAYWQVRYAPGPTGAPRRVVIGYRDQASRDPIAATDPSLVTTQWRDVRINRPENALQGSMFGSWIYSAAPLTIENPSSWIWTGAGVSRGSMVPGMFEDEVDRRFANQAQPAGVEMLADAFIESYNATYDRGETTLYTAPSGAQVFAAGTMAWSKLLAADGAWDTRIQQATANMFSRFAGDGTLGPDALRSMHLPASARRPLFRSGAEVSTVTNQLSTPSAIAFLPNGNAVVADGNRIVEVSPGGTITPIAGTSAEGNADGAGANARFARPHGLAVGAGGVIYVADTGNSRIRAISAGVVRTVAGSDDGFRDGVGSSAKFLEPMGIALTPSGSLLVADSWNQRLREVTPDGTVTTWAGSGNNAVVNGPGLTASISFPLSLVVLPDGRVVICEPGTGQIRVLAATPDRTVSVLLGQIGRGGWDDGDARFASVSEIVSLAADSSGQLFLIDTAGARVRAFQNGLVDTLAGGTVGTTVDGPGSSAGFGGPRGAAVAPDHSLWVVDAKDHAVRRITGL